ncbi:hypothetical protein GGF31_006443 [Allomyces arbusculus]|nr:hypothetical protein GGF31_006443 [Allomyces arbusculus]
MTETHQQPSTANVAVLGETQQGKSTLIKYLMEIAANKDAVLAMRSLEVGDGNKSCTSKSTLFPLNIENRKFGLHAHGEDSAKPAKPLDECLTKAMRKIKFGARLQGLLSAMLKNLSSKDGIDEDKDDDGRLPADPNLDSNLLDQDLVMNSELAQLIDAMTEAQIDFFSNRKHKLVSQVSPGTRIIINMIDTPGLNDTMSAKSPMRDMLHLTGALEKIRDLPGGHLHAVIIVVKYTTAFNSAFLQAIDTYLSNLAPICNKVIVVHSGYDPVVAIRTGLPYLDLSMRTSSLNQLLAAQPYFSQLDIVHLPMNNLLNTKFQDPATIAFGYQQRDRLLDLIANSMKHPTRPICSLNVFKPPVLQQLTAVLCAHTTAKLDGVKELKNNVHELSPVSEVIALSEELAMLKSAANVLQDDLHKIDNKDLIQIFIKEESHPVKWLKPRQQHTIAFSTTEHPIQIFAKDNDDRCYEIEELTKFEKHSASFTCKSKFWRGLTMRATAYTWSCDYHAETIREKRAALKPVLDMIEQKMRATKLLDARLSNDMHRLLRYQDKIEWTTTAIEYLLRDTVPLDLILKISSSNENEPKVLNRLVEQMHQNRSPAQADLDELFTAYYDFFSQGSGAGQPR